MPIDQYRLFMELLVPFQPENAGLHEGLSKGFIKNWIAGREERKNQRQERRSSRVESKNRSRETRAQAKLIKNQGKADAGSESFFDKVKDAAGGIFNKSQDGQDSTPEATPFYKKPAVIGIAAVLLIGGVYMATKPKTA